MLGEGTVEGDAIAADHRDQHRVGPLPADPLEAWGKIVDPEGEVLLAGDRPAAGRDIAMRRPMRNARPDIVVADEIPAPRRAMLGEPIDRRAQLQCRRLTR